MRQKGVCIEFLKPVVEGLCARMLPTSALDQQLCRNSARGCPGARFWLSGSTTYHYLNDSGCLGAWFSLSGSMILVVREHNLALPVISRIGSWGWKWERSGNAPTGNPSPVPSAQHPHRTQRMHDRTDQLRETILVAKLKVGLFSSDYSSPCSASHVPSPWRVLGDKTFISVMEI